MLQLNKNNILKKLAFGGLTNINKDSIELRKLQIVDDFRVHSCFDYDKALDVIKIASEETKIIPKLTTKVYFNFNTIPSRYLTILDQIHRIADKLKFVPKDWHIQICANPPHREFVHDNYELFKEKIHKNYGNIKYFIETETFWEKNTLKIVNSNFVDGSCFFMNSVYRGIKNDSFLKKPFFTIGMLSGGKHFKSRLKNLNHNKNIYKLNDLIEKNIIFFLKLNKIKNFKYSITKVSSKKNYFDLINLIKNIDNTNNASDDKISFYELIDYFEHQKCSSYGLSYKKFSQKLLLNKKRVIHEIKSYFPIKNLSKRWF